MRIIESLAATTHEDRHGDRLTRDSLEGMARQHNEQYIPVMFNHDPRIPPLGRVVRAEVVELPDGEFGLRTVMELFDENDSADSLHGDGRTMPIRVKDIDKFEVEFDRLFLGPEEQHLLNELEKLAGVPAIRDEKKALEFIPELVINAGRFAAGAFFRGFLSALGADAYRSLKAALQRLFRRRRNADRLLHFRFGAEAGGRKAEVSVLATNPTDEDISTIMDSAFARVDDIVGSVPIEQQRIARLVFQYQKGETHLEYMVREDAVPIHSSPRESAPDG